MPRQKNAPARDTRGETRQKYTGRVKREIAAKLGRLPHRWDLLATWPDGLDRATWERSTHYWQIQHVANKTSGDFYGWFRPLQVELAHRNALELARAIKLGFVIVRSGDTSFSIHQPLVDPESGPAKDGPALEGVGIVRSNDACDQFCEQAEESGVRLQKYDSFRRWLQRHGVRRHHIGGRVWADIEHLNQTLRKVFGATAPTIRPGAFAPTPRSKS